MIGEVHKTGKAKLSRETCNKGDLPFSFPSLRS